MPALSPPTKTQSPTLCLEGNRHLIRKLITTRSNSQGLYQSCDITNLLDVVEPHAGVENWGVSPQFLSPIMGQRASQFDTVGELSRHSSFVEEHKRRESLQALLRLRLADRSTHTNPGLCRRSPSARPQHKRSCNRCRRLGNDKISVRVGLWTCRS